MLLINYALMAVTEMYNLEDKNYRSKISVGVSKVHLFLDMV